ncbi:RiPP maturation radical SAM C-methyltransferase (plasmid) [Niallia sp. XMNu-256]|uniref:RiPP maturation radical SAM C-methyltransferase n=1 Tax=Niallia sp. XMNu-256 TaxID=3082444 RepID=UPI0030CC5B22
MKVCLVNMPFGNLYHPSIGISLLQSGLNKAGIECDTYNLNLLFGSIISPEKYNFLLESISTGGIKLAGEWIFSSSLFNVDNVDEYNKYLKSKINHSRLDFGNIMNEILSIREQVEPFIDKCLSIVPWDNYDIIGFTTVFEQNVSSLSLAKRIKDQFPNKFIIFGGANCEGEMGIGLLKNFLFIDAVCVGEGDHSFIELVKNMNCYPKSVPKIKGIVYQDCYNNVVKHIENISQSNIVQDMDSLPYPNYDDYFAQFVHYGIANSNIEPRILFESSRGCWWGAKSHCVFCGLNGLNMNYRSKSGTRALDELVYLKEKYSLYTNKVSAVDNIIDMKYFKEFLPTIRDLQLDLDMFYETKANLTQEQVKLFKDAGFKYIQPGIESLITDVLQLMKKGVSMLQNIQLLKWSKEYNVTPLWNFLYGFPGENPEGYLECIPIIKTLTHLKPPMICSPVRLVRFSPYFNNPSNYGISNIKPFESYQYVYLEQNNSDLMNIAYYFDFSYDSSYDIYINDLKKEIESWKNSHDSSEFFTVSKDKHLIVVDLRPFQQKKRIYTISGSKKIIYEYCQSIRKFSSILQLCNSYNISSDEVVEVLDYFLKSNTMLKEGDRYLSLAIPLGEYSPGIKGLQSLLNQIV